MGLGTRSKRKRRREEKRRLQRQAHERKTRERVVRIVTCAMERGHVWFKDGDNPGKQTWLWRCKRCPATRETPK
jgi:hypothetical protein